MEGKPRESVEREVPDVNGREGRPGRDDAVSQGSRERVAVARAAGFGVGQSSRGDEDNRSAIFGGLRSGRNIGNSSVNCCCVSCTGRWPRRRCQCPALPGRNTMDNPPAQPGRLAEFNSFGRVPPMIESIVLVRVIVLVIGPT